MDRFDSIPASEARANFASLLSDCAERGGRFAILSHGKPVAALLGFEEWRSIVETLEIMSDPKMMRQIEGSLADIKAGRHRPVDEVFREILSDRKAGSAQGRTHGTRRARSPRPGKKKTGR